MTDLLTEKKFDRGTFVKGSGALVVGFSFFGLAGRASAGSTPIGAGVDPTEVDSWLEIRPDNTITLYTGKVELTGGPTGLLQIAAEELDVSLDQITHSNPDTFTVPNQGATWGSNAISTGGPQVRAAAVSARQALLQLASAKLGVPVAALSVSNGVVVGGGQSVKYGDLVGGKLLKAKLVAPTLAAGQSPAKPVAAYRLVGTNLARKDIPAKVVGKYTYVHNVRVPGMLHGRVVRPKGQLLYGTGAPILSVDEGSIKHIAGARVVRKGDFIGVVASHEYAAVQAAAQLKVKWDTSKSQLPTSGNLFSAMRQATPSATTPAAGGAGDVDAALAGSAKTVSGTFAFPYNMHGSLGPVCAVADVRSDGATVMLGSQNMWAAQKLLAKVLSLQPSQVRVAYYEGSGCYGGNQQHDVAVAAALMSQAVGKPVRVQFMRSDEHGWDNYFQPYLIDVRAGIDGKGKLVGYEMTGITHGWNNLADPSDPGFDTSGVLAGFPLPKSSPGLLTDAVMDGRKYVVANRRGTVKTIPQYLRASWMRAPTEIAPLFASEQIIDMLAHEAGMDPVAFRKQNITDPRWLGVLDAATQAAKWQPRVSASQPRNGAVLKGRGVSIGGFAGTYAGIVADVEVNTKTGKVRVTSICAAVDCGLAVNPNAVRNQAEGGMVQAVSRTLHEELPFTTTSTTARDWVTYPILRFKDAPTVTSVVVQRTDMPSTGAGEPAHAPTPAAIANAFFDATGIRATQLPLTPARVRALLKKGS